MLVVAAVAAVAVPAPLVLVVLAGPLAAALVHCAVTLVRTGNLALADASEGLACTGGAASRSARRGAALVLLGVFAVRFYTRLDRGWPLAFLTLYLLVLLGVYQLVLLDARRRRAGAAAALAARARGRASWRGGRARPSCSGSRSSSSTLVGIAAAVMPFLTLTVAYSFLAAAHFALPRRSPEEALMAPITFDHVTKRFDETIAVDDLSIEVADGEFLVLVGPSGCGKTTALRMLAGLEDITSGRILIGDRVVNNVAPGARDVAMVFQSYALYPHMTVYDNLAFGLRNYKVPKAEIDRRVQQRGRHARARRDLLKRKPKQLSGGQRQRVALGRAIVREPAAFLMDEPLSNLDAALRVQTRAEILKLQQRLGTTTIYVTHDQVEAMTMGDRIAVMRKGVLQQIGTPEELYDASRQHVRRQVHRLAGDEHARPRRCSASAATGQLAGFRPEHVGLGNGSRTRRSYDAAVEVVEYLGDEQLAHVRLGDHEIVVKLPVEPRLKAGEQRDLLRAAREGDALRRGEQPRSRNGSLALAAHGSRRFDVLRLRRARRRRRHSPPRRASSRPTRASSRARC